MDGETPQVGGQNKDEIVISSGDINPKTGSIINDSSFDIVLRFSVSLCFFNLFFIKFLWINLFFKLERHHTIENTITNKHKSK